MSGRYPAFVAPTGSCARPSSSCRLRSSLLLQVFAGCCEPLLHDGPSRRYLCDPCTVAWVRTPPRFSGALVRFFPLNIGLSSGSTKSARETILQHSFTQGEISGLQPFAYVQASVLAWPPDCSDQTNHFAQPRGRIHRAVPASLPTTGSGIATCPNPDN